eukprot:gene17881-19663_t
MLTTHSLSTTAPCCNIPPTSPMTTTPLYEIKPFRHTLKQFLKESPSERNIQQARKWSLVNYAWLQHMNQLLPPTSSDIKRFWLDRHIAIPGSFSPPPSNANLINYYNTCYSQLQHQIIYAASQAFRSPFMQALLKRNIGNPCTKSIINTGDDEDKDITLADQDLDESFWPSVQEQIQKMMLHQSPQQYTINYELPLIDLHDAYAEKQEYSPIAPHVSVLEPYIPYDLSLIDVYEFRDVICFFKRDEPLDEDEFHDQFKWFTHLQDRAKLNDANKEDFRDFSTWLRLLNKSFIQITHAFPSQKHYIDKQFISPHFQHYNFLFYGFSKHLNLLTKLAIYLKLLPLKDEPWCRMSYSVHFYRPYTSWECIPAKQEGCGCCTDYSHNYTIDDQDADHFLSECLELVLPFRTLHEKQQK